MQPTSSARSTSFRRVAFAAIAAVLTIGACGDGSTEPERPGVATSLIQVSGTGQPGTVGGLLPLPLTVEVRDEAGRPLAGVAVGFQVTAGGGTVATPVALTDASGRATTTWTLGAAAGEQRVSASAVGIQTPVAFTATAAPGPAAVVTIVSGSGQSAQAGSQLPAPLVIRATDSFGNAVTGAMVTFAVTAGGGSVTPASVATDGTGHAETRLTLGTGAGANTVSATVPGAAPVTFTATSVAAPEPPRVPTAIVVVSGSGQTATVNTTLTAPLVVEVRDAQGRPVSGVPIGFQVVTGSGTVVPTLAVSGQDGRASAGWTLGTSTGVQQVSVTALGVQQPAVFTATAVAGAPVQVSVLGGNGQSASVGAVLPVPFSVRVVDAFGNPVAGATVTFAVTAGGGSLTQSAAVTDASGRAETRLTLGSSSGANTVSASVPGAAPVTFTATALATGNQRIAYVNARDGTPALWVINPDGTGRTHLTNLVELIGNPSWSPDGGRLVFQDEVGGQTELFTINRDGTGRTRLTETNVEETEPAWSPNGSRIAMVVTDRSFGGSVNNGIYVMNADGTGRQRVLSGRVSNPAWSPDGTRLLFTREYIENNATNLEVSVANADGTNEVRLTNSPGADREADWSPDGTQIAFAAIRPVGDLHLWVMNSDGSAPRSITGGTQFYNVSTPAWSPDGSRIAFNGTLKTLEDGEQIWTVRPDGAGLVQVTTELTAARQPAWSPR